MKSETFAFNTFIFFFFFVVGVKVYLSMHFFGVSHKTCMRFTAAFGRKKKMKGYSHFVQT